MRRFELADFTYLGFCLFGAVALMCAACLISGLIPVGPLLRLIYGAP